MVIILVFAFSCIFAIDFKDLCALRGYFGPPMRLKNNCLSPISSNKYITTIAQV